MGFQSILAYLGKPESPDIVESAARLARESGARLKLVDVLKPLPVYLREPIFGYAALSETLQMEAHDRLVAAAAPLRASDMTVDVEVLTGKAHEEVVRETLRGGHDLVVAPSDTEGMTSLSASTAMRLCRLCPAPVLAIRDDETKPFRKILATVDPLSAAAEAKELNARVIDTALEIARLEGGRVSVLFVWGEDLPPDALASHGDDLRSLADAALKALVAPYESEIAREDVLLEFGEPAATICRVAGEREGDLAVLGTIARSGVQGLWIGNTAEKTLGDIATSVLAIKPAKFESPIELE